MSRLKPYKPPDDDPLELMPAERFERACMIPGELRTYGQLIHGGPTDYQPSFTIQLWNFLCMQPPAVRPRLMQDAIYYISFAYRVPKATVEYDMGRAIHRALKENLRAAIREGRVIPIDSQMAQEAIERARVT